MTPSPFFTTSPSESESQSLVSFTWTHEDLRCHVQKMHRHFSPRKAERDVWVVIHQLLLRPEWRQLTLTRQRTEADPVKRSTASSGLTGRTEYFPPSFVIDKHLSLKIGPGAHASWALALGCRAARLLALTAFVLGPSAMLQTRMPGTRWGYEWD